MSKGISKFLWDKLEMFVLQVSGKYFPVQIFILQIDNTILLENNSSETNRLSALCVVNLSVTELEINKWGYWQVIRTEVSLIKRKNKLKVHVQRYNPGIF